MDYFKVLNKKIRETNICKDGLARFKELETLEQGAEYMLEGANFCLQKQFPDLAFLRQYKDEVVKYDILIDQEGEVAVNTKKALILGESDVKINYKDFAVAQLYVANSAVVNVEVADYASLMIYGYNNAKINLTHRGEKLVGVYTFGDNVVTKYRNAGIGRLIFSKIKPFSYGILD